MRLISQESLEEMFYKLLKKETHRQDLHVSDEVLCYLHHLLLSFLRPEGHQEYTYTRTLAEGFISAVRAPESIQLQRFKVVGDTALFLVGFSPQSRDNARYAIGMGNAAYNMAAHSARTLAVATVFQELTARFQELVDLLNAISVQCGITDNSDLLQLYSYWVMTGSPRAASTLRKNGISLTPTPESLN